MHDINSKVAEVKGLIEKKVLHPYLLQNIKVPVIDEDKLLLLISTMEGLGITEQERDNYALTAMLIQIALDTHEHVTNKQSLSGLKERQLTVLAGDYFSGLYYKLLAESDDILMIRALSRGIKEVNEHKILFYQKDFDNIELLLLTVKNIEASLLSRFSEYFGQGEWTSFVESFLLIKRLLNERNAFIEQGNSPFFEALGIIIRKKAKSGLENYNLKEIHNALLATLDRQLVLLLSELKTKGSILPNMNGSLNKRIEEFAGGFNRTKIFVEEG